MISHIKTPSNRLLFVTKRMAPLAVVLAAAIIAGFVYAPLDTYLVSIAAYLLVTIYFFFNDDLYYPKKS